MPSDLNGFFYCYLTFFIVIYLFNFLAAYASLSYIILIFYLVYIFIECCPVSVHYANRLIFNVLCNDTFKTTCMSNVYLFLSVLLLYVLCRPMSENSSAELMFMFIGNRL